MESSANAPAEPPHSPRLELHAADAQGYELLRTTDQYQALFHSMDQGFCVLDLQFDATGQQVVDFRYQQLNPVFFQQSGIPVGVLGKTSREVMPDLEPFWFETYGRVALTGESVRLEHYVPQVDRWFDVHTFRVGAPEARQVGVLFSDITARKRYEANLAFLADVSQDLVGLTNIDETMAALGAKLGAHFHVSACLFNDIDEAAGLFSVHYDWHRADVPSLKGVYRYEDFHTEEFRRASRAGDTYVVRDGATDPRVNGASLAATGIGAFVNVPLVRDGAWRFNLAICDARPRDWRPDEVELLQELTTRIWTRLERARAEEAMAASEEKYRSLFASIDEGFVVSELLYDEQGRPVDALMLETNPSYDRITQTTGAAGRRARELFPAAESAWFETYAHVVETGEGVRLENYFAPLDRWIEMFVVRVGGSGSRRFASVFTDITARKQQAQQQAFLLRFSDALRAETSATRVADRALGMLGEQLQLDRCYIGLYHLAEDRATFPHQVGNHRVPPLPAEVRLSDFPDALRVTYDRTLRIDDLAQTEGLSDSDRQNLGALGLRAIAVATLRRGSAGPQWAIAALSADVRHWTPGEVALLEEATERTWAAMERARAEEALRHSEEQFRLFVTASSDILYRMDADWQHMLQLDGRNVLADTAASNATWLQTYIPPADRPTVEAAIQAAIAGPHFFALEHRVLQADGSVGWMSSHAVPVLNADGELVEWFGAATDITARKQAEEALQRRTEELRASNEQLTRTNADLDNFVYTASHDLRVPIVNIEGLLLALDRELPPAARTGDVPALLHFMQDSVNRFQRTIAHLTDVSKLQHAHDQPLTQVHLPAVVEAVRLDLLPLIAQTQARLDVDVPADAHVPFSEKNLRSVVYNLLGNALKYHHPDRPPEVQLTYQRQEHYHVLRVQDNGLGLDLAHGTAKLFGLFQRLHTHVEGTGIGLYMVKKMVENGGGRIEVASQPGEGTAFTVFFPVHPAS